ncbi:MAG: hypothetical protein GWP61_14945 [Chloroflexi bacterium]|nr:hypothetical protein [Chloroflexota bacterium]
MAVDGWRVGDGLGVGVSGTAVSVTVGGSSVGVSMVDAKASAVCTTESLISAKASSRSASLWAS